MALWLDENTGVSALITLFIILFCAILIPLFSEFDFTTGYFAMFLGICILLLIILEICRCFRIIEFSRTGHRFTAYLGAITFSLYLLYDIDLLLRADASQNNWATASQIAYYLYLDIVNLLLYLLEIFAEG
jgi:FtsH-binding integral membrane protein